MALVQPLITRLHYRTAQERNQAIDELETMGIFADRCPHSYENPFEQRLIFAESEYVTTKVAIKRMANKPMAAEIFDPQLPWELGFRPIN